MLLIVWSVLRKMVSAFGATQTMSALNLIGPSEVLSLVELLPPKQVRMDCKKEHQAGLMVAD